MAENKTEEEILETDTVNEEASSAEEETKKPAMKLPQAKQKPKKQRKRRIRKQKKKEKRRRRKKIRKTNRSKNFRIGSDARWQSLITSVRERKKKKPRCLKSELRVLSKRSFRS